MHATPLVALVACMSINTPSTSIPIVKSTTSTTTCWVHVYFCTIICQFPPTTLSKTKKICYITICMFKSLIIKFRHICKPINALLQLGVTIVICTSTSHSSLFPIDCANSIIVECVSEIGHISKQWSVGDIYVANLAINKTRYLIPSKPYLP